MTSFSYVAAPVSYAWRRSCSVTHRSHKFPPLKYSNVAATPAPYTAKPPATHGRYADHFDDEAAGVADAAAEPEPAEDAEGALEGEPGAEPDAEAVGALRAG